MDSIKITERNVRIIEGLIKKDDDLAENDHDETFCKENMEMFYRKTAQIYKQNKRDTDFISPFHLDIAGLDPLQRCYITFELECDQNDIDFIMREQLYLKDHCDQDLSCYIKPMYEEEHIAFIRPKLCDENSKFNRIWLQTCRASEYSYNIIKECQIPTKTGDLILPRCIKRTMTLHGNIPTWLSFLDRIKKHELYYLFYHQLNINFSYFFK